MIKFLAIKAKHGENDKTLMENAQNYAVKILASIGAEDIRGDIKAVFYLRPDEAYVGLAIHEMGTARMGDDPEKSVLNKHNQVWGVDNLYCTDGACMCSSAVANPSLTYMALTKRAIEHALKTHLKNKE